MIDDVVVKLMSPVTARLTPLLVPAVSVEVDVDVSDNAPPIVADCVVKVLVVSDVAPVIAQVLRPETVALESVRVPPTVAEVAVDVKVPLDKVKAPDVLMTGMLTEPPAASIVKAATPTNSGPGPVPPIPPLTVTVLEPDKSPLLTKIFPGLLRRFQ